MQITPENLKRAREKKSLSQAEVADFIGVSQKSYQYYETGQRNPKIEKVEKLIEILGLQKTNVLKESSETHEKRVPFYDATATAGDKNTDMMPVTRASGYIDTGDLFGKCEAAIRIRGNSMLQGYPSGSILGLNRHYDSFIQPGELYVLETRSQRVFKRIFECTDAAHPNTYECYSDNSLLYSEGPRKDKPFYPVFYVPKEEVISIWNVAGSARENSNSLIIHTRP